MKPLFIATLLSGALCVAGFPVGAATTPVTVDERFVTAAEPAANIDSVAVTPARDGQPALLFATAKETDVIKVFDASNGSVLREIGRTGSAPDEYRRPNGIAVIDDLLVVVERDNRRVNIRSLHGDRVLAVFGDDRLRKPYGLWLQPLGQDRYRLFVTDAFEAPDESVPPNDELDERVKAWRLAVERDDHGQPVAVHSEFERSFGETTPPGALRIVESIFGDSAHGRLLIAEEDESPVTGLVIKVYNLDGQFTGRQVGKGIFTAQAEGIALYACNDGSGYWLSTDQAAGRTVYHLFDRKTLRHAGAFTGRTTANTDGIWLAQDGVPGFAAGAFFAVHDDQAVSAFDWAEVMRALELPTCRTGA
jgi:3-phytase